MNLRLTFILATFLLLSPTAAQASTFKAWQCPNDVKFAYNMESEQGEMRFLHDVFPASEVGYTPGGNIAMSGQSVHPKTGQNVYWTMAFSEKNGMMLMFSSATNDILQTRCTPMEIGEPT